MQRRTLLAAGALGLTGLMPVRASVLSSARAKQVYGGSTILIGQSAVQSGPSALLGQEMALGMRAAFAAANKSGGVAGRRIELVSMDDTYEPAVCQANTAKLIDQGVFALGGYVGTPTCLAAFPAIVETGIPFVGAFTGAESLRKFAPNVFHTRASYNQECRALAHQLLAYGEESRVAVFAQDDAYGAAIEKGVTQALGELGKKVVAVAKVKRNSLDVAAAAEIIAASGATGIAMGSVYGACAKLIEALGVRGQASMYCSVSFIGTSGLTKNLGPKARGIGITQVMPYPWLDSSGLTTGFRKAMSAIPDAELSYGALEGYLNAVTIMRGIAACGETLTWQRFVEALERRHDFGGFALDFSSASHEGSKYVDLTVIDGTGRARK